MMNRILSLVLLALALATAPAQAQSGRRISVSFNQTEMVDVLRTFAEFSGQSIIMGAGVGGRVTAEVRNQPWDVAMRAIVESHGLGVREVGGGMIRVDAAARLASLEQQTPLVTRAIRLNYVPAEGLAATLQPLISDRGSLVANKEANVIIVTDTEDVVARIVQIIGHP